MKFYITILNNNFLKHHYYFTILSSVKNTYIILLTKNKYQTDCKKNLLTFKNVNNIYLYVYNIYSDISVDNNFNITNQILTYMMKIFNKHKFIIIIIYCFKK